MGSEVSWLLAVSVKEGELDNFKALMNDMVDATQGEPGALIYEWFISDDGETVAIYERYADSAATMVHMGSFSKDFAGRFMGCVNPTGIQVFGDPSDEVRGVLDTMGASYMGPLGGFAR